MIFTKHKPHQVLWTILFSTFLLIPYFLPVNIGWKLAYMCIYGLISTFIGNILYLNKPKTSLNDPFKLKNYKLLPYEILLLYNYIALILISYMIYHYLIFNKPINKLNNYIDSLFKKEK